MSLSALASQCAQHCSDDFADSGEMSSGIVILGLVLALVLAQETQDNRPQHLIHVRLADIKFPTITTRYVASSFNISRGLWRTLMHEIPCLIGILKFCGKWLEDQSTLTLIF